VIERRRRSRLAQEPLTAAWFVELRWRQRLQSHYPAQPRVAGFVDPAHAARADALQHPVRSDGPAAEVLHHGDGAPHCVGDGLRERAAVLGVVGEQRLYFPAKRLVSAANLVQEGGSRLWSKLRSSVEDVFNPLPAPIAHTARQSSGPRLVAQAYCATTRAAQSAEELGVARIDACGSTRRNGVDGCSVVGSAAEKPPQPSLP
jgi:hypothetical protein